MTCSIAYPNWTFWKHEKKNEKCIKAHNLCAGVFLSPVHFTAFSPLLQIYPDLFGVFYIGSRGMGDTRRIFGDMENSPMQSLEPRRLRSAAPSPKKKITVTKENNYGDYGFY